LAQAWALVSSGPARMLGLADRGAIVDGGRADLLLATTEGVIVTVIVAGRARLLVDTDRIKTVGGTRAPAGDLVHDRQSSAARSSLGGHRAQTTARLR
ncbi:MAG: hypothetical protein ACRCTI_14550, partial [Beijerinckiaceae bacterium]